MRGGGLVPVLNRGASAPTRPTNEAALYCSAVRSVERRRTRTSTRPPPFHSTAPCPYTFVDQPWTRTSTRPPPFHSTAPCPYTFVDHPQITYRCKPWRSHWT